MALNHGYFKILLYFTVVIATLYIEIVTYLVYVWAYITIIFIYLTIARLFLLNVILISTFWDSLQLFMVIVALFLSKWLYFLLWTLFEPFYFLNTKLGFHTLSSCVISLMSLFYMLV